MNNKLLKMVILLASVLTTSAVYAHTKCRVSLPFGGWTEGCPHFHSAPDEGSCLGGSCSFDENQAGQQDQERQRLQRERDARAAAAAAQRERDARAAAAAAQRERDARAAAAAAQITVFVRCKNGRNCGRVFTMSFGANEDRDTMKQKAMDVCTPGGWTDVWGEPTQERMDEASRDKCDTYIYQ